MDGGCVEHDTGSRVVQLTRSLEIARQVNEKIEGSGRPEPSYDAIQRHDGGCWFVNSYNVPRSRLVPCDPNGLICPSEGIIWLTVDC